MNAELPPFKKGKHTSESTSAIDRVIAPLILIYADKINKAEILFSK